MVTKVTLRLLQHDVRSMLQQCDLTLISVHTLGTMCSNRDLGSHCSTIMVETQECQSPSLMGTAWDRKSMVQQVQRFSLWFAVTTDGP
jgi:hypothetical protein